MAETSVCKRMAEVDGNPIPKPNGDAKGKRSFGTMVLAILTRATKLILVVLLFIGRVDSRFLANNLSEKQSAWVSHNLHIPCIFQYSHATTSHFNIQVTMLSTHALFKTLSLPQMHVSNRFLFLLLTELAFESKT